MKEAVMSPWDTLTTADMDAVDELIDTPAYERHTTTDGCPLLTHREWSVFDDGVTDGGWRLAPAERRRTADDNCGPRRPAGVSWS